MPPDDRQGSPDPRRNATELFAEYLETRDAGGEPDVDALCARAGPLGDELRERIRALSVLDQLGSALRGDGDGDEGAVRAPRVNVARLGRYENLRLLGEGGLSRVYVAVDPDLQREVALKVIASEHVTLDAARNWILQEGRTIARLEHPGIVRVFDLGEVDGLTFVAMELVDGPSLADVLDVLRAKKRGGVLPSDDARVLSAADRLAGIGARITLALRIARALAACHAGGVFHRDIKPGNVLLAAGGEPKLIDFGLAHLEEAEGSLNRVTQRLIGTPAYIAPEQVESGQTGKDPRSDQFSFGVLLYELITLEPPFQRSTRTETLDAVTRALPTLPSKLDAAIPSDLETICLHALERLPGDRYPSMDALADDLEAFLEHRAISVSSPGVGRRLRLWARRNRRDVLMFGVPAAVLALGVGIYQILSLKAERDAWLRELAGERAAVARLVDPVQVQSAFMTVQSLESRGRELDRRLVSSALYDPLQSVARAQVHAISARLASRIAEGLGEAIGADRVQRADAENSLFRTWEAALALEAALCPECTENAENRERGRVDLPEPRAGTRLEVRRMRPGRLPMEVEFVPVDPLRTLGVGEFRIEWLDEASRCLGEFDLFVQNRTRRATLILEPIPAGIRDRFVHVPKGFVKLEGPDPVEVPEFWAYAGWFSAPDIRERADEKALTHDDSLEVVYGPLGTVPVPGQAAYTARGLSARLPTALQALRILDVAHAGGSSFEPLPAGIAGEFCSGWAGQSGRVHLRHTPDSPRPYEFCVLIDVGSDRSRPYAFRLVTTHSPKL